MKKALALIFICYSVVAFGDTFSYVKGIYVGRKVILIAAAAMDRYQISPNGDYVVSGILGGTYNRKEATVLSVEEGKIPSLVKVIVKCDDGTLAGWETSPSNLDKIFEFVGFTDREQVKEQFLKKKLNTLVGSVFYVQHDSALYPDFETYEDIVADRTGKHLRTCIIRNLSPAKVVSASIIYKAPGKIFDQRFSTITLEALDKSRCLAVIDNESFFNADDVARESDLLRAIPPRLTPRELEAIKHETYFRGMRLQALKYSIGKPAYTNDYGLGGLQLVYDENTYIYVKHGVVSDWHLLKKELPSD